MGKIDVIYKQLLYGIQEQGFEYQDVRRSSVKRKQIKSANIEIPMSEGFPLLTLKAMPFKLIVSELLWFLKGQTNIYWLHANNNHIWDQDAYNYYVRAYEKFHPRSAWHNKLIYSEFVDIISQAESFDRLREFQGIPNFTLGDVGKNYSYQWASWKSDFNQIYNLVRGLRKNPMDSRHIVTGWNPKELYETALPPCHWAFEALVALTPKWKQEEEGWPEYNFTLKWHQRSVDTFLGLPFNIASYAMMGIIIQTLTGIHFSGLIGDLSNVHIYSNHYEAIKKLAPLIPTTFGSPEVTITTEGQSILNSIVQTLNSSGYEEEKEQDFMVLMNKLHVGCFQLHHYQSFEKIQADMVAPDKI